MISVISIVLAGIFAALAGLFLNLFLRYRARLYRSENRYGKTRIQKIRLNELADIFSPGEFGVTLSAEVFFAGQGNMMEAGTISDTEAWILSVLARQSRTIFEFGTCTGRTAYLLARNSPPDARVTTLTLHPKEINAYQDEAGDSESAGRAARDESRHSRFFYNGTCVEGKIEQVFCDSKHFNESPYENRYDLIFIDGSHAYSYLKSDTQKAMRMIKPGGLILWHDYRRGSDPRDVERYLNELGKTLHLSHIEETSLVAYRHHG